MWMAGLGGNEMQPNFSGRFSPPAVTWLCDRTWPLAKGAWHGAPPRKLESITQTYGKVGGGIPMGVGHGLGNGRAVEGDPDVGY